MIHARDSGKLAYYTIEIHKAVSLSRGLIGLFIPADSRPVGYGYWVFTNELLRRQNIREN